MKPLTGRISSSLLFVTSSHLKLLKKKFFLLVLCSSFIDFSNAIDNSGGNSICQTKNLFQRLLKPFTKIIHLSLETFSCLCCVMPLLSWIFISEKSDRSSFNKELDFERFTVSLAEFCLHETVNNELKTYN